MDRRGWKTLMLASLGMALSRADAHPAAPAVVESLPAPPLLSLSGYAWAENLDFDGRGNLYVSDSERGEIWRIWLQDNVWTQELFFEDACSVNGLAVDDAGDFLYATARRCGGEHQILRVPLANPAAVEVVVDLEEGANGLEFGADGTLYATLEGSFIPGQGAVLKIDTGGSWDVLLDGLWGADGIAVDRSRSLMYVTQVVNNKVLVIRLPDGAIERTLSTARPSEMRLLDDIALSADGSYLIGADFGRGDLLKIPVDGGQVTVVYQGLDAPTSVLYGEGPTFSSASIFVTEGGGFTDMDEEQRVLEIIPTW